MKKTIYIFFFLIGFVSFAQNPIDDIKSSPNGYFDKVFDQYGNQYDLKDLQVGKDEIKEGILSKNTLISCDSGIFELYFETGCGMDDVNDPANNQRRDVVCRVLKDISDFIDNTPLKNPGNTTKVKIWVRKLSNLGNVPANALGLASSFYTMPRYTNNVIPNFGGIIDSQAYKIIQGGKDPYENIALPVLLNDYTNSKAYYHGMMAFNFNSINWNTNLQANPTTGEFDLYSVVLHEITHLLGFNSLINNNGQSIFNIGFNYFSRYDTFLKNNTTSQSIVTNSGANSTMYNYSYNQSLPSNTLQPNTNNCVTNETTCSDAIKFYGTSTVPVYTPNCFEASRSYSHFEDLCISSPNNGNDTYFTMSNSNGNGSFTFTKRFLKPEERNALIDIGYSLKLTYGNNSIVSNSNTNYQGNVITGTNVQGINDGLNGNKYTFIGDLNSPITLTGILDNDYNALQFEALQDIYDPSATLSSTFGTNSTQINFSSNVKGLHLLRYVPVSPQGKKGNITYIYVFIDTVNNGGIPNNCDLVINGDFEQHNGLPTGSSQLNGILYNWNTILDAQSTEYYHEEGITGLRVPCNVMGYEIDNQGKKAYVGMYMYTANDGVNSVHESIRTKLKEPLQQNKEYQLSFDISLTESHRDASLKCQAYLSKDLIVTPGATYIPVDNPNMLFTSPNYNITTNGWEHIVFNFSTNTNAGEQYLYIGGGLSGNIPTLIDLQQGPFPNVGCSYPSGYERIPYYYIDNVKLVETNAVLNLPSTICSLSSLPNLLNFITGIYTSGVFTGSGIIYDNNNGIYSFNATTAGTGNHTITYTYTNSSGCSVSISDTITVSNSIIPTFTQIAPVCSGTPVPTLPTASNNDIPITGTWSLTNTTSTAYTFTFIPNAGQCATPTTMTITILNSNDPSCTSANCLPNLTLNTPETNSSIIYKRQYWIVTNTNYEVSGNKDVKMKAGDYIILQPGTYIKNDSKFLGKIENCTTTSKVTQNKEEIENVEIINRSVSIYPNPTQDFFTINSTDTKLKSVEIMSIEGKVIFTRDNLNSNKLEIDFSKYQNGIYIVNVTTMDNKVTSQKIIKN